jgi:hypothetical protein
MNSSTRAPSSSPEGGTAETVDDLAQPSLAPAEAPAGMPLPSDLRTAFQGGLFFLAFLAALYTAREIVLPVVLAFVLALLLQPAVRMLDRLRVPRALSAFLLIVVLLGAVVGFGTALAGPAASWAAKLPEGIPRLQEHLSFLRAPIEAVRNSLHMPKAMSAAKGPRRPPSARPRPRPRNPAS